MADTNYYVPQNMVAHGSANVADNPVAITQAPKANYQTMKTFTGVLTTSTTVTTVQNLYTVTAGKTFYITDVAFCNNSANPSQVSVNASATVGASPVIIGHAINTAPFELTNIGTEPSIAGGSPLVCQFGQTSVATAVTYFVSGYEQ